MNIVERHGIQILDEIRKGKNAVSKKELHLKTKIPWGTVCRIVDALISEKLVFTRQEAPSGRGRPVIPLCINPEAALFLGIDIGSTQTKLVFCDLAFNILSKDILPTPAYSGPEKFFSWLNGVYDNAVEKFKIPKGKIKRVGLSVSGNVDSGNGLIVSGGNFGMKWGANLPVERFEKHCGVKVHAMTTQVAAVWAEYNFGLSAGCANLVTVGLGVGIGSGVVSNNQLLISHPSRPIGYIGHMLIPGNTRVCTCGFKGCLESYSGGKSLAVEAAKEMSGVKSAEMLDLAAMSGNAKAQELLLKAASYNAVGIASMIQLYSPEAMVFSGGQSRADGFLYTHSIEALNEILPEERRRKVQISITALGRNQSALGAARLAYETLF